jgi:hypothetical protein
MQDAWPNVFGFGQPRSESPAGGYWWSCHPSAGGRAAARVGHPDLRDLKAQVNLTNFA